MRNPVRLRLRHLGFISLLAGLFLLLSPVYAALVAVTGEFQVNTTANGTLNDFRADIGVNTTTGEFIVVWQSDVDLSQSDVYFQRYNSAGVAQGGNTLIHAANVNDQRRPRIAVNPSNGDFVVVWESDDDTTAAFNYNIYARVFNASGTALTGEILVAGATGAQTDARVAINSSGNFVVVWQSLGDGSSTGIYFQRYNSVGTAQGSATQANVSTANPQVFGAVAMDNTGNFVIVWRDASLSVPNPDIVMRKFDPVGAALTGEVTVGSTTNLQSNPVISMRPSTGDFVVVWESNAAFANAQVYFQRYNSSLTPQGSETLVSTNTGDVNQTADVSMNSNGDFMVTWARTVTVGTELQVEGRRYNASGTSIGTEFRVDTASGQDTTPVVGFSDNNYALFAWPSSPNNELYARVYADNADLVITKTSAVTGFPAYNDTNFVPGATLRYTITVTNSGPSGVVGAVVTDTLPPELAGATWTCNAVGIASCVSGSPSGTGAASTGNISQSIDIAAGGGNSVIFLLTKIIPTTQLTGFSNTASVATPAGTGDSNLFNNSAIRTLSAVQVANLSVSNADSPDPVTAGRDITYTITVANGGPSNANNVSLSDTLPAGTTFVSLSAPGGWSCTTPSVGGTGTVGCSITALNAAANGVFTLVLRTNPGTGGSTVNNTATATSTDTDPNGLNNSEMATTTVAGPTLVFTQQPTTTNIGSPITPAVTVELRDSSNAVITTDNSSQVSLAIGTNPGGGTLTGGGAVTVVNGVATFAGLSINNPGVGYTLVASSAGASNTTSSAFDITAQPPTQLTFGTQPTDTVAGASITPSVTVEVRDASNAIVTGDNVTQVTLTINNNPGGGTLGGTVTQTAVNGIVTFPGINIDKVGTGYTLDASATGLTGDTSNPFNITVGAPDHVAFVQQPTDATAGVAISPSVTVQVLDAFDNLVTTSAATIDITINNNPGGGTLSGTASVAAVNGVATFNNLSIDKVGVGYTLDADSTGLTGDTSTAFNITAAAPDHVAFVQQPTNTVAGAAITPAVTVEIRDAFDNVITTSAATVNIAIGANPGGGTLGGTTSVAAVNGVATFSTLGINAAGVGYTLTASSAGLTGDTSSAFNIIAGAADHLVFVQQPTNTAAGNTITPAVTVQVLDVFNNVLTADNSTQITLAIGTNPGGGTLNGTLTRTVVNGVATFNDLSINEAGVGYTLTASAAGLTGDTSSAFNISPGAPTQLAFVQQPTNALINTTISPAVTVQITDPYGNLVPLGGQPITLAIGTNPGGGTLGGTTTQASDGTGLATFSNLSINQVGVGYTLTASAPGLSGATSTVFNISFAAADRLTFLQQPTNTAAGNIITPSVTVEVRDTLNNVITTDNSTQITLAIGTNPVGGTLNGTLTRTVVNGVATFNDLSINEAGVGYTLTASSVGLTGDTSTTFNISPGAPTQLAFVQQPTNALINTTISPAMTVQIVDPYGNAVPLGGQPITLAIGTNPGGGTLGGTTTQVSDGTGLATFNNLNINQVGVGYTLVASAPGLSNATSTAFNISFGAPDHVTFLQQPTNTAAGNNITPAVTVEVRDSLNNVITTDNSTQITLAIGTNPVGGTLNGTLTQTVINGVATFNNLSINEAGVGYTLTASSAGLTGDTSSAFNIAPAAPVQLTIVQQPTNTVVNSTISPAVTVQIVDPYGNAVPFGGQPITLGIGTNPGGGALGGTTTQVSDGTGLATFNNLSIDQVGVGYTLSASAPGLTGTTSTTFNITAGAPSQLTFLQQPTNTVAGNTITPAVTVEVRDTFNNVVTSDNSTQITLAIGTNPASGTLNGTLTQTVVNGVATFNNLSINQAGVGYTLTAAAAGLTGATSSSFDITVGAAAALIFVQQPTNTTVNGTITPAVTVQVVDAFNNAVAAGGTSITLAIGTNPSGGTLGGTLTQATDGTGLATFNDLTIDQVGVGYTLVASAAGLTGATSTAFNIIAGVPSQIAFNVQPSTTNIGGTITPAVTVEVRDSLNNVITTDNSTQITLAIGTNPGGGTLSGTLTQTVVNGVATFANLSINQVGTGYTLVASTSGFSSVTSNPFDITNLPPTQLAFAQQPTNTLVNTSIVPSITVELRNALNAVVTTDNTTQVTIAIGSNPGVGALGGTLTQTAVNGIATFPGLSIDQVGVGYTLTASAPGLTGATSSTFDIFTVPNDTIVGVVFNDLNGNGVQDPGDTNMSGVTVYLDTNNNGSLDGGETSTVTDASGAYSFISLAAGSYNVRIVPSASFSVTTAQPAVVVVPQAPIVSIAIGQHAVVVPTSVPPTQTSGDIPATDPRAWSLTLSADPAFIPPGSTTTLTLTLSKLSGGTVVNLSSTLPAGFTIASVSSNRGTASFNGLTISFTDDMHVGDVATIVANLRVPQTSGVWTVTGCVTSPASLCAQTTITSVNNLPATGEGMPDVLRYVLLLGGAGVLALAAVSVFAKRNVKR